MISAYAEDHGRLRHTEPDARNLQQAIWVDLFNPTNEEEAITETALGIDIPMREEMEEIEISSRLYFEEDAAFMTATLPANTDSDDPLLAPVTFVLSGERLVTVRYHDPRAFQTFPARAIRASMGCQNGSWVLVCLLEAQVDRLADVLERAGRDITKISRDVLQQSGAPVIKNLDYQAILGAIGRKGDLTANIRECLVSLERMIGFLGQVATQGKNDKDLRARIKTLSRDALSLTDHAGFLTQKITFLLDATLGLINIEQNNIIKIFSVAAVVFLPPTLVASVYGMNFKIMPELGWPFGYPVALLLMAISAVLPYWFFKRRGWL